MLRSLPSPRIAYAAAAAAAAAATILPTATNDGDLENFTVNDLNSSQPVT